ncbi:MAG: RidA family protein [Terriglobia bacterium]
MKQQISTTAAPKAIGPYSQGVKANGFLFLSGQVPLDPARGQVLSDDIRVQTEQVLKNLAAVLEAAGSSLAAVVKTTVFLADLNDFAAMNEVYARFFPQDPPARATVEVARLPKEAKVEIDLIAIAEN